MRKKLFTLFIFLNAVINVNAQHANLWGVTNDGGTYNGGVIFRYSYTTNTLDTVYNFNQYLAHWPVAALSYSSGQGKFYGTATAGGNNGISRGGIYSFDPLIYTYGLKVDFYPGSLGAFPASRLFETRPGYYWSTSIYGGANNSGTIFTYDAASNVHTIRRSFLSGTDGYDAYDGIIPAPNGKMYGLTHGGLGTGGGVLYEIDTLTYAYAIKHQFAYATGNQPQGRLLLATDGNMYGTTTLGGAYNGGTFFRFNYLTNTLTHLFAFNDTTGKICTGHLIQASDGNIYGVTSQGGGDSAAGTIFRYNIANSNLSKVASFYTYTTGGYALGGLCEVPGGKLYGLMNSGGSGGLGTLYSFDIATGTIIKKIDFTGPNGASPVFTDLTLATTNTRPAIILNNLQDSVCAGTTDTLLFSISDPDHDTIQGIVVSSNSTLITAAGSTFSRIAGSDTYRLIYSANSGVTGSTNLSITLTDGYGATDTLHATVYVKECMISPTNLANTAGLSNGLAVSPNPAAGYIHVKLSNEDDQIVQLRIIDPLGKSYMLRSSLASDQVLNVSQFAHGVYYLQVITTRAAYGMPVILR